ncbi:glycoside hydrolase family 2 TIM barrel-domain containing protein [Marivivens aquimaris]|uniref:glycoside hydrolase family 2 TIM barrel-domain containing protein n=1 Tax=Marivivens aquimaris TaxID=2774876 RepID=UPI00187F8CEB|nr:glycoside hydrolase family 2 TIM barrel-domain containing protein [Marivivens aquimaris]
MTLDSASHAVGTARPTLSLDGAWDFHHSSDPDTRREARVPAPWQANFEDLAVSFGTGTYRRDVTVPTDWEDKSVFICFGAVSAYTIIRINGEEVARHSGPWLPFEVPCPNSGTFTLEVEATLPDARYDQGGDFAEMPHGKMSWYGPQGGIWQSVRLEARAASHIGSVRIDANLADKTVTISPEIVGDAACSVRISGPDGQTVTEGPVDGTITLDEVAAWSPDAPNLYTAHIMLKDGDMVVDTRVETFGFRSFTTKDGKFFLNGEPYYMRGALDQDYYPDGFGTPPSLELLEDQLMKAKKLGLNMLRCHIKVPDPRYYEVADRLGMLIWTEIPNVETFGDASAQALKTTMEGILERDRNHPSIVAWTIINEDWGTRLRESGVQRQWLSDMVDWLRAEDPQRLVVDNSACFPNYHVNTDINDYHFYRTVVERRAEWDLLCEEFAGNADWTFADEPECTKRGDEPLVVSEFGVWGLPHPDKLKTEDGHNPWWAEYGATWAGGAVYPVGIKARFAELGLANVFGSFDKFIDAVQWHQFENLKYEIEEMRSHAPIAGYVITEFTDVHWEGNGLMDMSRNLRPFADKFADVNTDVVIAPRFRRHWAKAGETYRTTVSLSTGGGTVPAGSVLSWTAEGQIGSADAPGVAALDVATVDASFDIAAGETRQVEVTFTLTGPDGQQIATSDERLMVFGERQAVDVTVQADGAWAGRIDALGYAAGEQIIVTDVLTPELIDAVHAGAHVLQLIDKEPGRLRDDTEPRDGPTSIEIDPGAGGMTSGHYFTFPGYQLQNRHKSIFRGDWVGNFSWLDRAAFPDIPGGPLLDLAFTEVVPEQVMTGFRPWEFQGRVHAGLVVGWVQNPAAFVIEKRLGKGKIVASTFKLESCEENPLAAAILDGLLKIAARA